MEEHEQYVALLTEVIEKQAIILGPDIAVQKARNVTGLTVTDDGKVTNIEGDPNPILQALISEYIELSGEIVRNVTKPIFAKYPGLSLKHS
jgi:hypothetical protein